MMNKFKTSALSQVKFYTACFTVLSFTFTSIVFPSALHAAPELSSTSVNIQDFSGLKIPESLAKVETVFKGDEKSGRSVVVIQDAHSIPDAQRSIRKTILFLEKEYGAKLIGVEGASGDLDTRIFQSYPDQEALQNVFKSYMDKGEMTGSVAAAIFGLKKEMTARGVEFFGVEDWPVYEEGLALYLAAMGEEETILKSVESQKWEVKEEKEKNYSKELLEVDQAEIAFEENSQDLLAYLKTLAAIKAPEAGSEITLLLNEADKGQADDAALDAEVRRLAARLKLRLGHLSPQGQKSFNETFQSFQTSQLNAAQFALALKDLSVKEGFKLPMSQGMTHQAVNQRRMRDLEGTKLFKDIEAYTKGIKESLFRNDIERQLDQRTHELILLTKWAKLELSRENWQEIRGLWIVDSESSPSLTLSRETGVGRAVGGEVTDSLSLRSAVGAEAISDLSPLFKYHRAFYENAEKRDEAFIRNLEKRLKPGQVAVMVAGGFHAQGLAEHLKAKGIDYALVMPNIEKLPEVSAYREHMKGNVDWKNYFEVKNGKINLYEAFVRYTRDRLLGTSRESSVLSREQKQGLSPLPQGTVPSKPQDPMLLKNWRDQIIRNLADEGKLAKAGEYTRFIDETLIDKKKKDIEARMQDVEKFIAGLKDLDAKGQFSTPNIVKLLQPAQIGVSGNRVATVLAAIANGTAGQKSLNLIFPVPGGEKMPTLSPEILSAVARTDSVVAASAEELSVGMAASEVRNAMIDTLNKTYPEGSKIRFEGFPIGAALPNRKEVVRDILKGFLVLKDGVVQPTVVPNVAKYLAYIQVERLGAMDEFKRTFPGGSLIRFEGFGAGVSLPNRDEVLRDIGLGFLILSGGAVRVADVLETDRYLAYVQGERLGAMNEFKRAFPGGSLIRFEGFGAGVSLPNHDEVLRDIGLGFLILSGSAVRVADVLETDRYLAYVQGQRRFEVRTQAKEEPTGSTPVAPETLRDSAAMAKYLLNKENHGKPVVIAIDNPATGDRLPHRTHRGTLVSANVKYTQDARPQRSVGEGPPAILEIELLDGDGQTKILLTVKLPGTSTPRIMDPRTDGNLLAVTPGGEASRSEMRRKTLVDESSEIADQGLSFSDFSAQYGEPAAAFITKFVSRREITGVVTTPAGRFIQPGGEIIEMERHTVKLRGGTTSVVFFSTRILSTTVEGEPFRGDADSQIKTLQAEAQRQQGYATDAAQFAVIPSPEANPLLETASPTSLRLFQYVKGGNFQDLLASYRRLQEPHRLSRMGWLRDSQRESLRANIKILANALDKQLIKSRVVNGDLRHASLGDVFVELPQTGNQAGQVKNVTLIDTGEAPGDAGTFDELSRLTQEFLAATGEKKMPWLWPVYLRWIYFLGQARVFIDGVVNAILKWLPEYKAISGRIDQLTVELKKYEAGIPNARKRAFQKIIDDLKAVLKETPSRILSNKLAQQQRTLIAIKPLEGSSSKAALSVLQERGSDEKDSKAEIASLLGFVGLSEMKRVSILINSKINGWIYGEEKLNRRAFSDLLNDLADNKLDDSGKKKLFTAADNVKGVDIIPILTILNSLIEVILFDMQGNPRFEVILFDTEGNPRFEHATKALIDFIKERTIIARFAADEIISETANGIEISISPDPESPNRYVFNFPQAGESGKQITVEDKETAARLFVKVQEIAWSKSSDEASVKSNALEVYTQVSNEIAPAAAGRRSEMRMAAESDKDKMVPIGFEPLSKSVFVYFPSEKVKAAVGRLNELVGFNDGRVIFTRGWIAVELSRLAPNYEEPASGNGVYGRYPNIRAKIIEKLTDARTDDRVEFSDGRIKDSIFFRDLMEAFAPAEDSEAGNEFSPALAEIKKQGMQPNAANLAKRFDQFLAGQRAQKEGRRPPSAGIVNQSQEDAPSVGANNLTVVGVQSPVNLVPSIESSIDPVVIGGDVPLNQTQAESGAFLEVFADKYGNDAVRFIVGRGEQESIGSITSIDEDGSRVKHTVTFKDGQASKVFYSIRVESPTDADLTAGGEAWLLQDDIRRQKAYANGLAPRSAIVISSTGPLLFQEVEGVSFADRIKDYRKNRRPAIIQQENSFKEKPEKDYAGQLEILHSVVYALGHSSAGRALGEVSLGDILVKLNGEGKVEKVTVIDNGKVSRNSGKVDLGKVREVFWETARLKADLDRVFKVFVEEAGLFLALTPDEKKVLRKELKKDFKRGSRAGWGKIILNFILNLLPFFRSNQHKELLKTFERYKAPPKVIPAAPSDAGSSELPGAKGVTPQAVRESSQAVEVSPEIARALKELRGAKGERDNAVRPVAKIPEPEEPVSPGLKLEDILENPALMASLAAIVESVLTEEGRARIVADLLGVDSKSGRANFAGSKESLPLESFIRAVDDLLNPGEGDRQTQGAEFQEDGVSVEVLTRWIKQKLTDIIKPGEQKIPSETLEPYLKAVEQLADAQRKAHKVAKSLITKLARFYSQANITGALLELSPSPGQYGGIQFINAKEAVISVLIDEQVSRNLSSGRIEDEYFYKALIAAFEKQVPAKRPQPAQLLESEAPAGEAKPKQELPKAPLLSISDKVTEAGKLLDQAEGVLRADNERQHRVWKSRLTTDVKITNEGELRASLRKYIAIIGGAAKNGTLNPDSTKKLEGVIADLTALTARSEMRVQKDISEILKDALSHRQAALDEGIPLYQAGNFAAAVPEYLGGAREILKLLEDEGQGEQGAFLYPLTQLFRGMVKGNQKKAAFFTWEIRSLFDLVLELERVDVAQQDRILSGLEQIDSALAQIDEEGFNAENVARAINITTSFGTPIWNGGDQRLNPSTFATSFLLRHVITGLSAGFSKARSRVDEQGLNVVATLFLNTAENDQLFPYSDEESTPLGRYLLERVIIPGLTLLGQGSSLSKRNQGVELFFKRARVGILEAEDDGIVLYNAENYAGTVQRYRAEAEALFDSLKTAGQNNPSASLYPLTRLLKKRITQYSEGKTFDPNLAAWELRSLLDLVLELGHVDVAQRDRILSGLERIDVALAQIDRQGGSSVENVKRAIDITTSFGTPIWNAGSTFGTSFLLRHVIVGLAERLGGESSSIGASQRQRLAALFQKASGVRAKLFPNSGWDNEPLGFKILNQVINPGLAILAERDASVTTRPTSGAAGFVEQVLAEAADLRESALKQGLPAYQGGRSRDAVQAYLGGAKSIWALLKDRQQDQPDAPLAVLTGLFKEITDQHKDVDFETADFSKARNQEIAFFFPWEIRSLFDLALELRKVDETQRTRILKAIEAVDAALAKIKTEGVSMDNVFQALIMAVSGPDVENPDGDGSGGAKIWNEGSQLGTSFIYRRVLAGVAAILHERDQELTEEGQELASLIDEVVLENIFPSTDATPQELYDLGFAFRKDAIDIIFEMPRQTELVRQERPTLPAVTPQLSSLSGTIDFIKLAIAQGIEAFKSGGISEQARVLKEKARTVSIQLNMVDAGLFAPLAELFRDLVDANSPKLSLPASQLVLEISSLFNVTVEFNKGGPKFKPFFIEKLKTLGNAASGTRLSAPEIQAVITAGEALNRNNARLSAAFLYFRHLRILADQFETDGNQDLAKKIRAVTGKDAMIPLSSNTQAGEPFNLYLNSLKELLTESARARSELRSLVDVNGIQISLELGAGNSTDHILRFPQLDDSENKIIIRGDKARAWRVFAEAQRLAGLRSGAYAVISQARYYANLEDLVPMMSDLIEQSDIPVTDKQTLIEMAQQNNLGLVIDQVVSDREKVSKSAAQSYTRLQNKLGVLNNLKQVASATGTSVESMNAEAQRLIGKSLSTLIDGGATYTNRGDDALLLITDAQIPLELGVRDQFTSVEGKWALPLAKFGPKTAAPLSTRSEVRLPENVTRDIKVAIQSGESLSGLKPEWFLDLVDNNADAAATVANQAFAYLKKGTSYPGILKPASVIEWVKDVSGGVSFGRNQLENIIRRIEMFLSIDREIKNYGINIRSPETIFAEFLATDLREGAQFERRGESDLPSRVWEFFDDEEVLTSLEEALQGFIRGDHPRWAKAYALGSRDGLIRKTPAYHAMATRLVASADQAFESAPEIEWWSLLGLLDETGVSSADLPLLFGIANRHFHKINEMKSAIGQKLLKKMIIDILKSADPSVAQEIEEWAVALQTRLQNELAPEIFVIASKNLQPIIDTAHDVSTLDRGAPHFGIPTYIADAVRMLEEAGSGGTTRFGAFIARVVDLLDFLKPLFSFLWKGILFVVTLGRYGRVGNTGQVVDSQKTEDRMPGDGLRSEVRMSPEQVSITLTLLRSPNLDTYRSGIYNGGRYTSQQQKWQADHPDQPGHSDFSHQVNNQTVSEQETRAPFFAKLVAYLEDNELVGQYSKEYRVASEYLRNSVAALYWGTEREGSNSSTPNEIYDVEKIENVLDGFYQIATALALDQDIKAKRDAEGLKPLRSNVSQGSLQIAAYFLKSYITFVEKRVPVSMRTQAKLKFIFEDPATGQFKRAQDYLAKIQKKLARSEVRVTFESLSQQVGTVIQVRYGDIDNQPQVKTGTLTGVSLVEGSDGQVVELKITTGVGQLPETVRLNLQALDPTIIIEGVIISVESLDEILDRLTISEELHRVLRFGNDRFFYEGREGFGDYFKFGLGDEASSISRAVIKLKQPDRLLWRFKGHDDVSRKLGFFTGNGLTAADIEALYAAYRASMERYDDEILVFKQPPRTVVTITPPITTASSLPRLLQFLLNIVIGLKSFFSSWTGFLNRGEAKLRSTTLAQERARAVVTQLVNVLKAANEQNSEANRRNPEWPESILARYSASLLYLDATTTKELSAVIDFVIIALQDDEFSEAEYPEAEVRSAIASAVQELTAIRDGLSARSEVRNMGWTKIGIVVTGVAGVIFAPEYGVQTSIAAVVAFVAALIIHRFSKQRQLAREKKAADLADYQQSIADRFGKPADKKMPSLSIDPTAKPLAGKKEKPRSDSATTGSELAKKIRTVLEGDKFNQAAYIHVPSLGDRDNFIIGQLFIVRTLDEAATAAVMAKLEQYSDEDITKASGEAILKWLDSLPTLKSPGEVAQSLKELIKGRVNAYAITKALLEMRPGFDFGSQATLGVFESLRDDVKARLLAAGVRLDAKDRIVSSEVYGAIGSAFENLIAPPVPVAPAQTSIPKSAAAVSTFDDFVPLKILSGDDDATRVGRAKSEVRLAAAAITKLFLADSLTAVQRETLVGKIERNLSKFEESNPTKFTAKNIELVIRQSIRAWVQKELAAPVAKNSTLEAAGVELAINLVFDNLAEAITARVKSAQVKAGVQQAAQNARESLSNAWASPVNIELSNEDSLNRIAFLAKNVILLRRLGFLERVTISGPTAARILFKNKLIEAGGQTAGSASFLNSVGRMERLGKNTLVVVRGDSSHSPAGQVTVSQDHRTTPNLSDPDNLHLEELVTAVQLAAAVLLGPIADEFGAKDKNTIAASLIKLLDVSKFKLILPVGEGGIQPVGNDGVQAMRNVLASLITTLQNDADRVRAAQEAA